MSFINNATLIRRDILSKLIKLQLNGNIGETDRIPLLIRPKNGNASRCCIHKDRAVLKYKIMGLLGFDTSDETDELTPLHKYFMEMLENHRTVNKILSVVDEACSSCDSGNFVVTNMCRGCVGRPCMLNCNKNAIDFYKGQAIIDKEKCVSCGLCQKACPYHAIIYTPVPCEEACPVKAINKNNNGKEHIDESNCIYCGKCTEACPFGAIVERSDVFLVVQGIQKQKKTVALVAPALAGQFKTNFGNIIDAIKILGFDAVIEVAEGAEITTQNEAAEWQHKTANGQPFMTTSCCPSFVNLVDKHITDLKPFVSGTKSPMFYSAQLAKQEFPGAVMVFFSPCLAKKHEAQQGGLIDYVVSFEELGAWMLAKGIETGNSNLPPARNLAGCDSRLYALAGGVTNAVKNYLPNNSGLKPFNINGLGKEEVRSLKALTHKTPDFNFLEVMSCENGCIGGCNTIARPNIARRQIENEMQKHDIKKAV
ncbi:MAG: 4Fe-4S binding protein [Bacteroidales bacterium]|nr:4Fe-4S binding protein [Bacteroidales bacterium]